jgi:hypothetical protein
VRDCAAGPQTVLLGDHAMSGAINK